MLKARGSNRNRASARQAIEYAFFKIRQMLTSVAIPNVVVVPRDLVPRTHAPIAEHHFLPDREIIEFVIRSLNCPGKPSANPKNQKGYEDRQSESD